jgi:hypothetical protein
VIFEELAERRSYDVWLAPFLGSTGRTAQPIGPTIDNTVGIVTFVAFSLGSQAGPQGTGLLVTITFVAVGSGTCELNLQDVAGLRGEQ